MPDFICPIDTCRHHNGFDCTFNKIKISTEAEDFSVNIVCEFYEEPAKKCSIYGNEIVATSNICINCMIND